MLGMLGKGAAALLSEAGRCESWRSCCSFVPSGSGGNEAGAEDGLTEGWRETKQGPRKASRGGDALELKIKLYLKQAPSHSLDSSLMSHLVIGFPSPPPAHKPVRTGLTGTIPQKFSTAVAPNVRLSCAVVSGVCVPDSSRP